MSADAEWISAGAFVLSLVGTELYRRFALRRGLLDRPNARSSHSAPTPRGGGLAIVLASIAGFVLLAWDGTLDRWTLTALSAGIPVAAIGFADDRWTISARLRLVVHLVAALAAVLILNRGGLIDVWSLNGVLVLVTLVLGVVWSLNLFNFMDGIDGIAAGETVFIAFAGGALTVLGHGSPGVTAAALVFGAATLGFLVWNWPPARIFMGDVGSGYLGFVVAVLGLLATAQRRSDFYVWLILAAAFICDSTVTLLVRFARGETVAVAHRTHVYQRLSLRFRSHLRVTLGLICINVFWLLPLATIASLRPNLGAILALISFVPLVTLAFVGGAGRPAAVSK